MLYERASKAKHASQPASPTNRGPLDKNEEHLETRTPTGLHSKPSLLHPAEVPPPSPVEPSWSPIRAVSGGFKPPDGIPSSLQVLKPARGNIPHPRQRRGARRYCSRLARHGRWGGTSSRVCEEPGSRSSGSCGGGWPRHRHGRIMESAELIEAEEVGRRALVRRRRDCSKPRHMHSRESVLGLSGMPPLLVESGSVPSSSPPW